MIKKKSFTAAFTLIELLVVITIIGILAGIALPVFNSVQVKGQQTKALAQAKQVGLALKVFAGENDGAYPGKGTPNGFATDPATANDAFAALFPQYLTNEAIFANKLVYGSKTPDGNYDNTFTAGARVKTLAKGENVYAYMDNLTDGSNASCPLLFDAPKSQGDVTFTNAPNTAGGIWSGSKAVVIRLDNSGTVETLDTTDPKAAFVKAPDPNGGNGATTYINALSTSANSNNLSTNNKVLMPDLN